MKVLDRGSKHLDNSIIKLEPDVVEIFPDAASVNEALRSLIRDCKENGEEFLAAQHPKAK